MSTTDAYAPVVPTREITAVSADGARIHVESYGNEGDPAVVLSHGWTCSTLFWAPVVRGLLARGRRVIAYDQRGHGRTPLTHPLAVSPATLADDLCAVLDAALAPGEQAVLVGHSMGGMTLVAAAGQPQLVERGAALVLCSTGMRGLAGQARVFPFRSEGARRAGHKALLHSRAPLGPITPLTKKALKYGTMGPGSTKEQVNAVARVVHACPVPTRAAWGKVLSALDLHSGLKKLTAPTAIVVGDSDRLTPPPLTEEMRGELPRLTGVHVLPGRGHMVPVEEPDTLVGVVDELVQQHLAPTGARTEDARIEEEAK